MTMNQRALGLVDAFLADASSHRVATHDVAGARVLDCGTAVPGGLAAGVLLARVCLADLATVTLVPSPFADLPGLAVQVVSDQPLRACLGAQYAGWQISVGKYFAMGSGPMRAKYAHEDLYGELPELGEDASCAVGVLETRKLPTPEVVAYLADKLGLKPERITLLVAPTASLAGTLQVVARSLETALHKLHTLHFDLGCIVSGAGIAPLPPVAKNDLAALGWTNDAVLYGGTATLWVQADDATLEAIGPRVPSLASPEHGVPFGDIFERYGRDFYKIDPLLFSPARVVFHNVRSGRTHTFGRLAPEVLRLSFSR
jgi:methenyltetrahydromethanopterin cyclohydrolase